MLALTVLVLTLWLYVVCFPINQCAFSGVDSILGMNKTNSKKGDLVSKVNMPYLPEVLWNISDLSIVLNKFS